MGWGGGGCARRDWGAQCAAPSGTDWWEVAGRPQPSHLNKAMLLPLGLGHGSAGLGKAGLSKGLLCLCLTAT